MENKNTATEKAIKTLRELLRENGFGETKKEARNFLEEFTSLSAHDKRFWLKVATAL